MREIEERPGKEGLRVHSEQQSSPRRGDPNAVEGLLSRGQPERGSKGFGNAEQRHPYLTSLCASCVAGQACLPGETSVSPLCVRKDHVGGGRHRENRCCETDLDLLMAHQLEAGPPLFAATPIAAEQRRFDGIRNQQRQQTDSTGFGRGVPMPLAVVAHWAITTIADSGAVEHAQTAIRFATLLRGTQRLAFWTQQYPIGLEGEVLPGKPTCFPG